MSAGPDPEPVVDAANDRCPPRLAGAMAALLLLIPPALILLYSNKSVVDDAYIGFRHSRNIVVGNGPVFNAGERVEGFTNLLWTLITAIPIAVGGKPEVFAGILGAVLAGASLVRGFTLARALGVDAGPAAAASLLLSFYPGYWLNAVCGLEGSLYSLLLVELLRAVLLWKRPLAAGVIGGLMYMTRPESIGLFPAVAAVVVWVGWSVDRRGTMRAATRLAWPWLGLVAAVTVWRLAYYGHALPNSVAAKSVPLSDLPMLKRNMTDGLWYAWGFARMAPGLVIAALAGFVLNLRSPVAWLGAMLFGGAVGVVAIHGGDWMQNHRLLCVYAPALVLLSSIGLQRVVGWACGRWCEAVMMALIAGLFGAVAVSAARHVWRPTASLVLLPPTRIYQQIAEAVKPVLRPEDKLATEGLGMFGYTVPDAYVHDFFGLADDHIAHRGVGRNIYGKTDYGYTINTVRPTLIVLQSGDFHIAAGFKKFTTVPFEDLYETYSIGPKAPAAWQQMTVCIRKDAVERMKPALEPLGLERFVVTP